MSTTAIDTTAGNHRSTPRPICAADGLPSQQRQALALQDLARKQPISILFARHGVSRKLVYQQTHKAFEAQVPEQAVCSIYR